MQKADHQRQKVFRLEDHLFLLSCKLKKSRKPPLLSSVRDILANVLSHMIKDLQKYYDPKETNLVLLTIYQPGMTSALNSGAFSLQEESSKTILSYALNLFNRFVNSNADVKLNQGFKVYFKVLSYNHYLWPKTRVKPVRPKKTFGCKSDDFRIKGCVDIPLGFDNQPEVFLNKCLLTSVILAFYCNEFYRTKQIVDLAKKNRQHSDETVDTTHSILTAFYNPGKRTSTRKQLKGGQLLLEKVEQLQGELNLSPNGPYEAEELLPILANHFNVQIHLLSSNQDKETFLTSYPAGEWLHELSQLFLFPKSENHVVPILNLKKFVTTNRQFCPICKITFRPYFRHYCKNLYKSCRKCKSYLGTNKTISLPNLPFNFCFGHLNKPDDLMDQVFCKLCDQSFTSKNCFKNHSAVCGGPNATKSRIVRRCSKCKIFHKPQETCRLGKDYHKCPDCFLVHRTEDLCRLQPEKLSYSWPQLVFFDFEFQNSTPLTCTECHKLKVKHCIEKKIGFKEASHQPEFLDIKCTNHLKLVGNRMPNFVTLWKETKLGHFDKYSFASDDLNMESTSVQNFFSGNYDVNSLNPGKPLKSYCNKTETTKYEIEKLQKKERKNVLEKFAVFLFSKCSEDYVFLSLNYGTDNMACILELFSSLRLSPSIIRKGNQFISLFYQPQAFLFLNASNYFKGCHEEIVNQFRLNLSPILFPVSFNNPTNFNYQGSIPNVNFFHDLLDTEEQKKLKMDYVKNFENVWCFKQQLALASSYKVEVLARACLKFLHSTLNFQTFFKTLVGNDSPYVLHPFNLQVTTLSAFTYKMFSCYCLNKEEVYGISHESTKNMKTVSRSEMELVSFLEWKHPDRNYQHAFSSSQGQKKFGLYPVDIYCPQTKEVIQMAGCRVHLHDENECKDEGRKKLTKSIYGKTKTELDRSELQLRTLLDSDYQNEVSEYKTVYECNWNEFKKSESYKKFICEAEYDRDRPLHRLIPRIAMRSGFSELFRLKWKTEDYPDEVFKIADINMLYSSIALKEKFGIGKPVTVIGKHLKKVEIIENFLTYEGKRILSGSVFCSMLAPSNEMFPFLPYRVSDKFNYVSVCRKCSENLTKKCRHKLIHSRQFTSVWTVPDINKALREGYQMLKIYELIFFPERRSILKMFVQAMLTERLKNSAPDQMTNLQKAEYCQRHNLKLELPEDLCLKPDQLCDNPTQKQFFKDALNSLYGKFSAKTISTKVELVRFQHRLEEIAHFNHIAEVYPINESNLMVEYETKDVKKNLKSNIYIGSEITAHARICMHDFIRALQKVPGAKIFQLETDCIMYSIPRNVIDPLPYSDLVGEFKNVVPVDCDIKSFFALGNKNYSVLYQEPNGSLKTILKVKGLSLTSSHITHPLTAKKFNQYIDSHFEAELKSHVIPQVRKFKSKSSVFNEPRFTTFEFKNDLYLKRYVKNIEGDYLTLPYGFCE